MLAADRLELPVTIEAAPDGAGRPDFVLHWNIARKELGVEVTEAGDATWQEWLTKSESVEGVQLIGGNEDGYVGNEPERIVVRDITDAILHKAKARHAGKYNAVGTCDLLIYENSEGGLLCERSEVIQRLMRDKASMRAQIDRFRQVHLLFGEDVYLDLFGDPRPPIRVSEDHADSWSDWLSAQAKHLRDRNFNTLDAENLAQELVSLSKADQRALRSHLAILLLHLLKWQFQSSLRTVSCENSIDSAREEIEELLEENPSFENRLPEFAAKQYPIAVRNASRQTGLSKTRFPSDCPFTVDQLRDPEYLPE